MFLYLSKNNKYKLKKQKEYVVKKEVRYDSTTNLSSRSR